MKFIPWLDDMPIKVNDNIKLWYLNFHSFKYIIHTKIVFPRKLRCIWCVLKWYDARPQKMSHKEM